MIVNRKTDLQRLVEANGSWKAIGTETGVGCVASVLTKMAPEQFLAFH